MTTTNADIIKRPLLRVSSSAEFKLNTGDALASAIDISGELLKLGSLTEKLSKSDVQSGGVVLPNLTVELDNSRGLWNRDGDRFRGGYINGSEIKITTTYLDDDDTAISPAFVYRGILKFSSCEWNRAEFVFKATLIPPTALFATEKIKPGILKHDTFKNTCLAILNRRPFTKYMTVSVDNFTMGWDVSAINYGSMTNQKVKDVLDRIMFLTGSLYRVDSDGKIVIEAAHPDTPVSVCTLRGHDMRVISESYDWAGQYTAIRWADQAKTFEDRLERDSVFRDLLQYDYRLLELADEYMRTQSDRLAVMELLLSNMQFLKRKLKLVCKWNPEIYVNKFIDFDLASEAITGDKYLVWNRSGHAWNGGKYWGLEQPGLSLPAGEYWRVLSVNRKVDGENMQIEVVQHKSDDEV